MMKMKLFFIALVLVFCSTASAQPYRSSIGVINNVEINNYPGIGPAFKLFFTSKSAAEVTLYFNKSGYHASLLYQYHFPLDDKKNVYCYAGAGVYNIIFPRAVAGFEYKFANTPLVISADWRPYYIYFSDDDLDPKEGLQQFGLSLRYILNKGR